MDYQQSRSYIEDAQQYGSVLGLENMKEMMGRLGNPQDKLEYIHVAGTNGKGSVIAYLYSTLLKAGYRAGRYISPATYSYRERMEAAGTMVSREKFARHVTRVADVASQMTKEGLPHPTPFEIETAVAFLFFEEEKCSPVLMEVGMGGDLDATNIIKSVLAAVIMPVGMDHQEFLGKTLREIAEKKAGIIKPGCTAICAAQQEEAMNAIEKQAKAAGVELHITEADKLSVLAGELGRQSFSYKGNTYEISLPGMHQPENACVALEALDALEEKGFHTDLATRKEGLKDTRWPGRFSVIHTHPLMIVDGAHNPQAAEALAKSVEAYFGQKDIYYIMGMFKDKDYDSVLRITCPYAKKILAIETPGNPRALPAEELAKAASKWHNDVEAQCSIESAVEKAFQLAGEDDVILAFGSLSFIGDMTRIVENREERSYGRSAGMPQRN